MNHSPTKGFLTKQVRTWGGIAAGSLAVGLALFPVTHGVSLVAGLVGAGYASSQLGPYIAGARGERAVGRRLTRLLPTDAIILHDVVLSRQGKSTQIDHIVVTDGAVLVVETKGHSGRIDVSANERYWHQVKVTKAGRAYHKQLYNPLFQNRLHQRAVAQTLEQKGIRVPVYSLILFSNPRVRLRYKDSAPNVLRLHQLRPEHLAPLFPNTPSVPATEIAQALQSA